MAFGNTKGHLFKDGRYLLKILLIACKIAIRRKWYKSDPSMQDDRLKTAVKIYAMEDLTRKVRTNEEQHR